jgi:hypothetical protein
VLPAAAFGQNPPRDPPATGSPILREPKVMASGFDFAGKYFKEGGGEKKEGWYPVLKTGVTGDGWISGGAGYRRRVLARHALVDGSAAVSWRGYKIARASIEFPDVAVDRVSVGSEVLWQDATQLQYFGAGADSRQEDRSDYRLNTSDFVAFAKYRPQPWVSIDARLGYLPRPTISSSTGTFDRNFPDAATTFAHEPGFDLERQPSFVHGELSATADTRDAKGHPTRGGVYRAAATMYADRDAGRFSFRRYELEAAHFVPLSPDRWTLALHGWTVVSDSGADSQIPAYLLPSLGGSTTLRSYTDYRFHDRHLLLLSGESRWALFSHVDAALFLDAGSVASRVGDLTLDHVSYGAGLRAHIRSNTFARLDVARGSEGWRVLFRLSEPFRLNRISRRMAAVPFIP